MQAQSEAPGTPAVSAVVELTHRLSELDQRAAHIAEYAHSRWPLEGLVLPAEVRHQVGDLPELLSRAAGKVSEAAQAASHVRVAVRQEKNAAPEAVDAAAQPEAASSPALSAADAPAAAASRFVDDAEALINEAHARTAGKETL